MEGIQIRVPEHLKEKSYYDWMIRNIKNDVPIIGVTSQVESTIVNQIQKNSIPKVKRILKSGNRTIVFWTDDTKTIVKRAEDEPDNDYAAFTAALGVKIFGSNSKLKREIATKMEVQEVKKKKSGG